MKKNPLITTRNECPICGSKNIETIFNMPCTDSNYQDFLKFEPTYSDTFFSEFNELLKDENFKVEKCSNCSLVFQAIILNDAGMKKYYEDWISNEKLQEYRAKSDLSGYYNARVKFVETISNKTMKILDWGAGTGEFCMAAKEQNHEIYAYEFSEERVKTMSQLGVAALTDNNLQEEYFDFINIDQVLEHLSQPLVELTRIARFLKKDGIIFVSVPNCINIEKLLRTNILSMETFKQISPHQHINAFNNSTLKFLCHSAGLELVRAPFVKNMFAMNVEKKWIIKNFLKTFMSTSFFLRKATV